MDRTAELTDIMKSNGLQSLCKHLVETGAHGITEAELVAATTKFAADANPSVNPDIAFAKLYESDVLLRKACQVAKENEFAALVLDMTPQVIGGENFQPRVISGGEWRDDDDREQAMKQLAEIGQRMAPTATPEKQFSVAFEDPKNAALAQRAHQRPSATTSFPFPR
jgi:hypothetical protein